jgi:hypothetical protein
MRLQPKAQNHLHSWSVRTKVKKALYGRLFRHGCSGVESERPEFLSEAAASLGDVYNPDRVFLHISGCVGSEKSSRGYGSRKSQVRSLGGVAEC